MHFPTWTIWRQDRQGQELYCYAPGCTGRARFLMYCEELIAFLNERLGEPKQKAIMTCIDAGWHVVYECQENSLTAHSGLPEILGERDPRPYDVIQVLIEAEGGSMDFRPGGRGGGGTWAIQIGRRAGKFRYHPELRCPPAAWGFPIFDENYDTESENTLVPGAREQLLAKLE